MASPEHHVRRGIAYLSKNSVQPNNRAGQKVQEQTILTLGPTELVLQRNVETNVRIYSCKQSKITLKTSDEARFRPFFGPKS